MNTWSLVGRLIKAQRNGHVSFYEVKAIRENKFSISDYNLYNLKYAVKLN